LAILIAQVGFAQNLLVHPSSVGGVEFSGSSASGFNATVLEVLGPNRSASNNDWLPYSAVLTNHLDQPIVAVVAQWVYFPLNGRKESLVLDRDFLASPAHRIGSGKSAVVLPYWIFDGPPPAGYMYKTEPGDMLPPVQFFQRATRVEITLDAVVYGSGHCAGPDQTHKCEDLIARQSAEQIYSDVGARHARGQATSEIVGWLKTLANEKIPRDPKTGVPTDPYVAYASEIARKILANYSDGDQELFLRVAASNAPPLDAIKVFR
jgi:hypothetical protein